VEAKSQHQFIVLKIKKIEEKFMKKQLKHTLVAIGLSTLLVPTFINQVVYAQEESHEMSTSVTTEEKKKEIDKVKKTFIELQEKNKQKILDEIEQIDWDTISFSQTDVKILKDKLSELYSNSDKKFYDDLKRKEEEVVNSSHDFEYWKKGLYSIVESESNGLESVRWDVKYEIFSIAVLKKKERIISQINKNPHYTNVERERLLTEVSSTYFNYRGPNDRRFISEYSPSYDKIEDLNEYLKKIVSLLSDDFQAISLAPTEKNIREVNAVAFMEKTAISNDATLSKADKVSMFSKIDDIVEEAIRKIKIEADIHQDSNYKNSRMLSEKELSVFTNRIEEVYQGNAKPKVTKEEALQAVSTGTSTSTSSQSQSKVVASGGHQASKWFKESGKWYYNDLSGKLVRNRWVGRYYLKSDGSMAASEWIYDADYKSWFYVDSTGSYVEKAWQGKYYLKRGGYMAASEWIYDTDYKSWFYVDSTGSYVEKAWQGEYYLKRGGYMAKSEWVFDYQYNSWYYLNQDGKYARNQWIKYKDKWYYLLADGKMAKNMTINGYKVNEEGEWV